MSPANLSTIETFASEQSIPESETTQPLCPHFGRCGGCSFQHLSYEQQLKIKQAYLENLFQEVPALAQAPIHPMIPSPKPYHYRNVITLNVRQQAGVPYFGFIENDRKTFFPIEACPIAEESINQQLPAVMAKFVAHVPEKKRYRTSQVGVRVGMAGESYATIRDKSLDQTLSARVLGKTLRYPGYSFFQVNYAMLDQFVTAVNWLLGEKQNSLLIDLYCGVGLFAITLADEYETVLGIEESEESIRFATQNAKQNNLGHVSFVSARTEEAHLPLQAFSHQPLHVIVDPPRKGMHPKAIQLLLELPSVEKIVYVSCHPEALVKDLQQLHARYQVVAVQPCDMFPQTKHVETIVLLVPHTNQDK